MIVATSRQRKTGQRLDLQNGQIRLSRQKNQERIKTRAKILVGWSVAFWRGLPTLSLEPVPTSRPFRICLPVGRIIIFDILSAMPTP